MTRVRFRFEDDPAKERSPEVFENMPGMERIDKKSIASRIPFVGVSGQRASVSARNAYYFYADNVDELVKTLKGSSGFGYVSASRKRPRYGYLVKASVYRGEMPEKWASDCDDEARRYEIFHEKLSNGNCRNAIVPPLLHAGYSARDSMYFHVLAAPEDPRDLVSLREIVNNKSVTRDVYTSLESSLLRMWTAGAFNGNASEQNALYSKRTGVMYLVDLDSLVPLDGGVVQTIRENLSRLSKTVGVDQCLRISKNANELYSVQTIPRKAYDRIRQTFERSHALDPGRVWYSDVELLTKVWGSIVEKPEIPLQRIGLQGGAGLAKARDRLREAKRRGQRVMPKVDYTKPLLRKIAIGSSSKNDGEDGGGGWISRRHGRAWTTVFFTGLASRGESSGSRRRREPDLPPVLFDDDDGGGGGNDDFPGDLGGEDGEIDPDEQKAWVPLETHDPDDSLESNDNDDGYKDASNLDEDTIKRFAKIVGSQLDRDEIKGIVDVHRDYKNSRDEVKAQAEVKLATQIIAGRFVQLSRDAKNEKDLLERARKTPVDIADYEELVSDYDNSNDNTLIDYITDALQNSNALSTPQNDNAKTNKGGARSRPGFSWF